MTDRLPVACELDDAERRQREAEIRSFLGATAQAVAERPDGIEIRFPGDADCLPAIAELVSLERTCCRFLRFELEAEPDGGPIHLRITGPEGTAEILRGWFG